MTKRDFGKPSYEEWFWNHCGSRICC